MVPRTDPIVISDGEDSASTHLSLSPRPPAKASKKDVFIKRKFKREDTASEDYSDDSADRQYVLAQPNPKGAKQSAAKGKGKVKRRRKESSGPDSESDELPEYFRQRRRTFDQKYKTLHDGGLRLPPDFSDIYFSEDERLGELEERPKFDKASGIRPSQPYQDIKLAAGFIPASIAQYLRNYQIEGVRFLHDLFIHQRGGILGDDMGLGKTIQVAAFLTATFGKSGDSRDAKRMRRYRRETDDWYPRCLIVCPGSLIRNWKNELERWGWWAVALFHGPKRDDVLETARAGRIEVMVTTYTTYKNSAAAINKVPWDVVVADECHCLKDPTSGITKAMNMVNCLCRIGLTGTAIQNNYGELWSLLNWTNPGHFDTRHDWDRKISQPLTVGQSHDATMEQLAKARTTAKQLTYNLLPRFFLRRLKTLIADQLPKKSDKVVFCPLSDIQREAYENITGSDLALLVLNALKPCSCGSDLTGGHCCFQKTGDGMSWKALIFPLIISLQKLSNHFNLLMPRPSTENPERYGREVRILQAAAPDRWEREYANRESMLTLSNPEYCGKWKVLRKLLQYWHQNGDKVLLFSHSVRLLHILQQLFNNTSYNISYLDGSLSYEERQAAVDDFNCDPNQFIFLISTKAGGVGLNITSANKVVIMDPHWNPSYDLQAQDRAYRIGQTRDVDVYRLISVGTIEEITYARQIYKQQQANIGYNASNERRYFTRSDLFGIQNLLAYTGDQGMLREIVNKTNVAEAKAGIKMLDVNMDEVARDAENDMPIKKEASGEDKSGGLRQLTAMLIAPESSNRARKQSGVNSKPKSDPVQAILACAGVDYTHENSEVIGSSKVEDELSKWAEKAGSGDRGLAQLALFLAESQDASAGARSFHFQYNPPKDVMQRQFCTMAKEFGFPGATQFALAVECMTQEERRNCLDSFYKKRIEKLVNIDGTKAEDGGAKARSETKTEPSATDTTKTEREVAMSDIFSVPRNVHPAEALSAPAAKPTVAETRQGQGTISPSTRNQVETASISVWISDDEETDEL
ncbi:P-loop containing nucleoside triphosphate hydrolase protein [Xylariaceae sp. FL1019]|nr:P-loop containing nucleoside triphosphate hydrolase protein [Xylariaceae sp. FL1019]